jgi:hypothetical protein
MNFVRASFLILLLPSLTACSPTQPESVVPDGRFVKKDRNGQGVDPLSGPWACVEDKKTGLLWEVKSQNENIQFAGSRFSWRVGDKGVAKGGACARDHAGLPWVEYDSCDTQDLVHYLNEAKLCGSSDWRLPSSSELRSIMFRHGFPGERQMLFSLFPRIVFAPYWTADIQEFDGQLTVKTIHAATGEEYWRPAAGPVNAILVSSAVQVPVSPILVSTAVQGK